MDILLLIGLLVFLVTSWLVWRYIAIRALDDYSHSRR